MFIFTAKLVKVLKNCALITVIIVLWQILPSVRAVNPAYLPPFLTVLSSWIELIASGLLLPHFVVSMRRIAAGFAMALLFGIPVGVCIGYFKWFSALTSPLINICRQIPSLALFPVFILFFGIGEPSKVVIVFWISVWSVLLNTITGVRQVDRFLIKAAKSMGAGNWRILRTVILPGIVPSLMTGIRLGAGNAVVALVAAEMIGAKSGLGFMVINAQYNFQISQMYAAILSIALIGVGVNQILLALEKRLTFWNRNV
jgi:NitT/TauT family transport system permease protein